MDNSLDNFLRGVYFVPTHRSEHLLNTDMIKCDMSTEIEALKLNVSEGQNPTTNTYQKNNSMKLFILAKNPIVSLRRHQQIQTNCPPYLQTAQLGCSIVSTKA